MLHHHITMSYIAIACHYGAIASCVDTPSMLLMSILEDILSVYRLDLLNYLNRSRVGAIMYRQICNISVIQSIALDLHQRYAISITLLLTLTMLHYQWLLHYLQTALLNSIKLWVVIVQWQVGGWDHVKVPRILVSCCPRGQPEVQSESKEIWNSFSLRKQS